MSVTAKCHNYTGCLLAYRGEEIHLATGAPMVCPECGKPVTLAPTGAAKIWRLVPWIILFGLIGAGAIVAVPFLKKLGAEKEEKSEAAVPATPLPSTPPPTPVPVKIGFKGTKPVATPIVPPLPEPPTEPIKPIKPKEYQLDVNQKQNHDTREEVLKRIDVMPGVSAVNKDKLYNSVQRARKMGIVLTIPFGSGRATMAAADIQELKTAMETPEVMSLRDDPTAVFVVLGYADSKGDEKENLRVSQKRADSVVSAMREKCNIGNVTHAVAMGGSTLHDAENLEKNRIAEIWVVLP